MKNLILSIAITLFCLSANAQTKIKKETKSESLKSLSIEGVKVENAIDKPKFATSNLQPNYISDQKDTSSWGNPDELHRQKGLHEYDLLIISGQKLIHGWGETKEVNYNKAIAICTEAVRIFPNLSDAYLTKGQAYSKAGNTTEAQKNFEKAKELAPYKSGFIDRCIAAIEGREYVDLAKIAREKELEAAEDRRIEKLKADFLLESTKPYEEVQYSEKTQSSTPYYNSYPKPNSSSSSSNNSSYTDPGRTVESRVYNGDGSTTIYRYKAY